MISNCSSPSPPASSSLKAEVKVEDAEVDMGPSTSGPSTTPVSVLPGNGFDMSNVFKNNLALQALLSGANLGDNPVLAISKLFGAVNGKLQQPASTVTATVKRENGATAKREVGSPGVEHVKKARLKVFSNGYFMTFDKVSSCQKKHFWRCEYKNTCKARMHTDIPTEKIVTFIHEHNHSAPTDEEIKLYGLDPLNIERNRVYIVGNIADPNQRRKIRKQVADQEAAAKRLEQQQQEERQKQHNAATIAAAQAAYARAVSSGSGTSPAAVAASLFQTASTSATTQMSQHAMLLAQLPFMKKEIKTDTPGMQTAQFNFLNKEIKTEIPGMQTPSYISPNLPLQSATNGSIPPLVIPSDNYDTSVSRQPSIKRRAVDLMSDDHDLRRDPMFEPTFEIARKLRKLWKGEPSRYPRTCNAPTRHFEFFLSKNDGTDEHLYVPMRIEQRDETHLKEALQEFCGQKCIGMLLFGISPKISVMFNQPMLCNWDNNQFFLLDISNPSRWRLMYVDDQAV